MFTQYKMKIQATISFRPWKTHWNDIGRIRGRLEDFIFIVEMLRFLTADFQLCSANIITNL